MKLVILGLSITSSWGNGHATTYRGLVRELAARGHEVLFLERDRPWYAEHRDLRRCRGARVGLYRTLAELKRQHGRAVREADAVIVGSFVPDGIAVGDWVARTAQGVTAFYDIDTPVTLARLRQDACEYVSRALVRTFDLYLSFTGGPILRRIEDEFGARHARPLYCAVDPSVHFPESQRARWQLGYLGTFSADRQPTLDELLVRPARALPAGRFVVAGAQYPRSLAWPRNVARIDHLPPQRHRRFYNRQLFTLNVTRADMIAAGYSPSVRLFEAAACGTPIISDHWPGIETFFTPGSEILLARTAADVLGILRDLPRVLANEIAGAARARVLGAHTAAHRAEELETYLCAAAGTTPLPVAARRLRPSCASEKVPA